MSQPERVKIAALRSDLAEIINRVRFAKARVLVTKHGEPVAALISMDELERLRGMYRTLGKVRSTP